MARQTKRIWGRLLNYIGRSWLHLAAVLLAVLISNISLLAAPLWIGRGVDLLLGPKRVDLTALTGVLGILAVIYGGNALFQWLASIFINVVANRTVRELRRALFVKLHALPIKYFDQHAHGDLLSRLTNDVDAIADGLLQGMMTLFSGLVIIIGTLFFMIRLNPLITLVVLVITPLCILVAAFIAQRSQKMFKAQSKILGELNGYIEEMIGNQKVVKAFGYEARSRRVFEEINGRLYHAGQGAQFYSSLTNPGTRFVNNIAYILVGVIGALAAVAARLSVGQLSSFLTYATQFARPINEITSVTTQLQAATASAERVFAFLDEAVESPDAGLPALTVDRGAVSFEAVDFSYQPDRPLLTGLNLTIPPGAMVAIVGPTGAGKTTLVNLLMRFYDTDQGVIRVNGRSIREVTRDSLRRSFGMVLQESWLFTGTIAANIAYARPEATATEIEAAAKAAYAHGFIIRLPQGYDTVISEDGGNLSQGQKQLLAIARVMLIDPPMLILDEATSNIDTLTELRIQQAFKALLKGRTSFVIAHRLSTIREADLILVMDKGSIIEQGNHQELLAREGFYARLYQSQFAPSH